MRRHLNVKLFISRRPVATTLLMTAMLLFGVIDYLKMPVSELSAVDFPTITVSASLLGSARTPRRWPRRWRRRSKTSSRPSPASIQ